MPGQFSVTTLFPPFLPPLPLSIDQTVLKDADERFAPLPLPSTPKRPAGSGGTQKGSGVNYGDLADEIKLLYERFAI